MQGNYWMITLNNYNDDEIHLMSELQDNETYKVFQYEQGAQCTSHIQGYIELAKKRKLGGLKQIYKRAHLEMRNGTQQQAIAYCTKEDTRLKEGLELGLKKVKQQGQGKRTDIEQMKSELKVKSKSDYIQDNPRMYAQMHRSIDAIYEIQYQSIKRQPPHVEVLYGKAGTGKTRYVYDHHDQSEIYKLVRSNSNNVWFNGYDPQQHKVLLIDDFYGWILYSYLLQLLDRYPMKLEIKGGMTNLLVTHIYITSNVHPSKWYKFSERKNIEALFRRIHKITCLDNNIDITIDFTSELDTVQRDLYLANHIINFD